MTPEQNKRLAETHLPDGTIVKREWSTRERYMLYASGFADGAGRKRIDPKRSGLGAYDRGYEEGRHATLAAVASYAKEIGYVPTVLRTTSAKNTEGNG